MKAESVFRQNNGDVTKNYYAEMNDKGHLGQLAVALFRAQKRSSAAKSYRRGKFTSAAYDVKNWSIGEIVRILTQYDCGFSWGWGYDRNTPGYEWVLYVELPTGQCSFHSPHRIGPKNYDGAWDGIGMSEQRIIAFCDLVWCGETEKAAEVIMSPASTRREVEELSDRLALRSGG
jgi:hypothetical protein